VGNLEVSGTATINNLAVSDSTTVGKNLTVKGKTTVQDIYVKGKIITGGDLPEIAAGEVLSAEDEVKIEGNDTAGTLTITINSNSELNEGDVLAKVTFAREYTETPRISVTAINLEATTLPVYIDKTKSGFEIRSVVVPQTGRAYEFDYIIVQ
jgi:hypothetical protein